MNKIRVIDLLNKMSKGEKVPKKIRLNADCSFYDYEYLEEYEEYRKIGKEEDIISDDCIIMRMLNDEIEVIEEPKELEKIKWSERESLSGYMPDKNKLDILARRTEVLKKTLNELIQKIEKDKKD